MDKNKTSLAKISRPKLSKVFLRQRLLRKLDAGKKKPVTWIVGPAGSGKTTLVASYLDARKLPCIWYKVDAGDADIATFFYYLGLAAKKAAPRFRLSLPLLTPAYRLGLPTFALRYFEELYSRLKPPFTIVFDNYQEADASSPLHEIIRTGLSSLPEGITVIFLSRSELPPALSRLRAGEKMNVIGWNDVRFTLEESRALIRSKGHRNVPDTTVRRVHQQSEGWASGLILMLEVFKTGGLASHAAAIHAPQEVFDYFADQVLDKLDSETRDFLMMSSFLPQMTARMAEKLTDQENADSILSGLNRNHFFTEKLQTTEPTYQYHPFLRAFLLARMKAALNSEGLHRLHNRAAVILEEAGLLDDAAALLIETGDWDTFVPFVLRHAPALMAQGRSQALDEWLTSIPNKTAEQLPWLLYLSGKCKLCSSPAESRVFFERAFHLFETQDDDAGACSAWSGLVDSYLLEYNEYKPLDAWIDWMDKRMSAGRAFPSEQIEANATFSMAGALAWRRPDHPQVEQWVDRAFLLSKKTLLKTQSPLAYQHVSYYIQVGRFDDCGLFIKEMHRKARIRSFSPLDMISIKIVEIVLCQTSVDSAKRAVGLVMDCMELIQETGLTILTPAVLTHGVYSYLSAGDLEAAGRFLADLESTLGNGRTLHAAHYYHIAAWHQQVIGDFHQAAVFAKQALGLIKEAGTPFPEAYTRLGLALALHETDERAEAVHNLSVVMEAANKTNNQYLLYLTLLTAAHFYFDEKREEEGFEALRQAMRRGRKNNYVPLANFWRPTVMARICRKALEAGIEKEYAKRLIQGLNLVPDISLAQTDEWPWPLKISTLGKFAIARNARPLHFPAKAPRKLLMLLKAIIACGPRGAGEDQLADLLWPEAGGDSARQSLDTGLHRLRQLLDCEKAIQMREGRVTIDPKFCWVDAHVFEEFLGRAEQLLRTARQDRQATQESLQMLERAIILYQGAFLDDVVEPWTLSYRERLRNKYLKAVQLLGRHLEQEGRFEQAVPWYEKGLEVDDIAEPFYCGLMRCYQAQGRKAEAVTVYQRCKRTLYAALKVGPSTETEALYMTLIS